MLPFKPVSDKTACKSCKSNMYGYARGKQIFWICYKCGAFKGNNFDPFLLLAIQAEPEYLLYLIESKYLEPVQ